MKKMKSTAKKLNTFFRILQTATSVCAVVCLVGLAVIGAAFLFDLDPDMIGSGYNALDLGFLSLALAPEFAPDTDSVLLFTAFTLAAGSVMLLVCRELVKSIRRILTPMAEGLPFHSDVSSNLKKMGLQYLVLGILFNATQVLMQVFLVNTYDLTGIFVSEKITHVTVGFTFDLSFLVFGAILFLLAYVFQYGAQLQQLSDETL